MSLWLCLRFDQLPLQCLSRSEEQPVVVLSKQRVLRVNDCAAALGIRPGMSPGTLRALANDTPIQLLERNTDTEQRALQRLCCWAYSITPSLLSWREDCLQLEIGGCLNLFKGLDKLLAEVSSGIGNRSMSVKYALAPTPKAAWLLSYADVENTLNTELELKTRLAPLSLDLLEDFSSNVASLRRAGLHTLGDILNLPASALGRRCGKTFTHFLQQTLGQSEDLQIDFQPPPTFSDEYWFGYEVKTNDELLPAAQLMLQSLCRFLRNTQLQTTDINWQLIGIDKQLREITVRSSTNHSNWENWYKLTCIRLEQLQLRTGVEGLVLRCKELHAGLPENIDLFSPRNQKEPLGNLLDRLRNRLGLQAIMKVGCRDEHLPELAVYMCTDNPSNGNGNERHCAQRPFWLMPQPEPLRQQGAHLYWHSALQLIYGPERIEDNWWQEAVSRDYYIAQNNDGQHYWIFRDRLARLWYIHGIFA